MQMKSEMGCPKVLLIVLLSSIVVNEEAKGDCPPECIPGCQGWCAPGCCCCPEWCPAGGGNCECDEQPAACAGSDLTISLIAGAAGTNFDNYGSALVEGTCIAAFAAANTYENSGATKQLYWADPPANKQAVLCESMYRLKGNRFEHIGLAWIKHVHTAAQGFNAACGTNDCYIGGTCEIDPACGRSKAPNRVLDGRAAELLSPARAGP